MRSGAARKVRTRALTLAVATLASLFLAEMSFRWLGPKEYAPIRILTSDGLEVPLSEMIYFLRHSGDEDRSRSGPRGRIEANLHLKQAYDRPTWDYFDAEGCVSIDINSLGFRDLEFPVEKPEGELRILAVGDSFTYGPSVQLDGTWPQILERALAEEREGTVEVINAGFATGSHNPPGYVDWIRSDALAFQPDLLIVGLCLNDMGDIPMLAYPKAQPEPMLGGVSQLLNYVQRELEQRRIMAEERDYGDVVRQDSAMWEATQEALAQIGEILDTAGIGFVVAVFPMVSQLGENYPYLSLHEMVGEFCSANDLAWVDLLPRYRGREESDLWSHPTDQHPNDVGNRLIAEGVHEFLKQSGLLK